MQNMPEIYYSLIRNISSTKKLLVSLLTLLAIAYKFHYSSVQEYRYRYLYLGLSSNEASITYYLFKSSLLIYKLLKPQVISHLQNFNENFNFKHLFITDPQQLQNIEIYKNKLKFQKKIKEKLKLKLKSRRKHIQPHECLASKVFEKLDSTKAGHFGYGIKPRIRSSLSLTSTGSGRSAFTSNVKFFVGDIIVHKKYGYRGAIAGWDATCQAPPMWIASMHPKEDQEYIKSVPHYKILVDLRDRKYHQITYVAEFNVVRMSHQDMRIRHKNVYDYFDYYDRMKKKYVMRDAIRGMYPEEDRDLFLQ